MNAAIIFLLSCIVCGMSVGSSDELTNKIFPKENVALLSKNATAWFTGDGIGDYPTELINDEVPKWRNGVTSGWTYLFVRYGKSSLTIKLSQVYSLNYISFYIQKHFSEYDNDNYGGGDFRYSYYVETSIDNLTWTEVCDRRSSRFFGLQECHFPVEPVQYIRIVPTDHTAKETNYHMRLARFKALFK